MITIQKIALFFTIIGALNWGCIGFLDFNFVSSIFSANGAISNVIYSLVGLCGLINIGLLLTDLEHDDHEDVHTRKRVTR
ncbi:MAG: DUF378 domain-containing protein [Bacilli bacterium]|nr:DUF378 domain-containing protein [Bacilli bacterium]